MCLHRNPPDWYWHRCWSIVRWMLHDLVHRETKLMKRNKIHSCVMCTILQVSFLPYFAASCRINHPVFSPPIFGLAPFLIRISATFSSPFLIYSKLIRLNINIQMQLFHVNVHVFTPTRSFVQWGTLFIQHQIRICSTFQKKFNQ